MMRIFSSSLTPGQAFPFLVVLLALYDRPRLGIDRKLQVGRPLYDCDYWRLDY